MRLVVCLLFVAAPLLADEIPGLVKQLEDPDSARAAAAEDALMRLGAKAVPHLLAHLDNGEAVIMRIGSAAVQPLVAALTRARGFDEHYYVIRLLGRLGPVATDAIPTLRAELTGDWADDAAAALTKITSNATWGIRALMDGLRWVEDTDAIDALARLGPQAKAAVPVLRKSQPRIGTANRPCRAPNVIGRGHSAANSIPSMTALGCHAIRIPPPLAGTLSAASTSILRKNTLNERPNNLRKTS